MRRYFILGGDLLEEFLNKVTQGDCIEVMKRIPDASVDLVLTDIPYAEVNRKSSGLRTLDKGAADVLTFDLGEFIDECVRVCSGNIYIFCGIGQVSEVRARLLEHGLSTRHCVWEKTNPSPMNGQHMWLSGIENCVYAKKRGSVHNEHCKNGVWRFPNGRSKQHPTEKPLRLFEYLVNTSSNEGMVVLDPCLGSGTTAVAAINTDRQFIGIEREPQYVDTANQRIADALAAKSNATQDAA